SGSRDRGGAARPAGSTSSRPRLTQSSSGRTSGATDSGYRPPSGASRAEPPRSLPADHLAPLREVLLVGEPALVVQLVEPAQHLLLRHPTGEPLPAGTTQPPAVRGLLPRLGPRDRPLLDEAAIRDHE